MFPSGCCKLQLLPIRYFSSMSLQHSPAVSLSWTVQPCKNSNANIIQTSAQAVNNLNSVLSCKTHISHISQSRLLCTQNRPNLLCPALPSLFITESSHPLCYSLNTLHSWNWTPLQNPAWIQSILPHNQNKKVCFWGPSTQIRLLLSDYLIPWLKSNKRALY